MFGTEGATSAAAAALAPLPVLEAWRLCEASGSVFLGRLRDERRE